MKPSYPYRGQLPAKPKAQPKAEPIELTPVELALIESPEIKPFKVGDRFRFLGSGPFRITAVFSGPNVIPGAIHEYEAVYEGNTGNTYTWVLGCDRYSHGTIRMIKNA